MSKPTPTPTPWKLDRWGNVVTADGSKPVLFTGMMLTSGNHPAQSEADANRDLAVRAVNNHADLIAALDELFRASDDGVFEGEALRRIAKAHVQAQRVLAKAKEQS